MIDNTTTYFTISSASEGIFRDKGSKFIGFAYPIRSEEEIKPILEALRSGHPKARHFCWAYRLAGDEGLQRSNDDGEPFGSAGRPILNTLLSNEMENVFVVVVRYFGGTLLGVPGLINAYKSATQEAIDQANKVANMIRDYYEFEFEYLQMNNVMRIIKEESIDIVEQRFDNVCYLHIAFDQSSRERIVGRLINLDNVQPKFLKTL